MTLPEFEAPPIAETVFGVQFDPIPALSTVRICEFWSLIKGAWNDVAEVSPLGQTIEPVGAAVRWVPRAVHLELADVPTIRLRAFNAGRTRMLEVENGWLVYHWQRTSDDTKYERYSVVRAEFDKLRKEFSSFVTERGLGSVLPNLWELGYVNLIHKGDLWSRPSDWPKILPTLLSSVDPDRADELQTMNARWAIVLPKQNARLQVIVEHGIGGPSNDRESLVLKLVVRGVVDDRSSPSAANSRVDRGLDESHEAIVTRFRSLASTAARSHWKEI